jgi:predicted nucleotidyltransferase
LTLCRWDTAPEPVRAQVKRFVRDMRTVLGENLIGIYLHGSMAMGCFNPDGSDIDLLVLLRSRLAPEVKRLLAGVLLTQSGTPRPLEVSFLVHSDLHPWRHPAPYDLHFSEFWRERFGANLSRLDWEVWGAAERTDPDLAAHLTIVRERGVVLYGPPSREVFPPVPQRDYLDALMYDFEPARDSILQAPVYGVLNLLRVYWYLLAGKISTKEEAGLWGRETLPDADLRDLAGEALACYRGDAPILDVSAEALERFALYVDSQVQRLVGAVSAPAAVESAVGCLRCDTPLRFVGVRSFVEGDPLHFYACPSCGKAELFLPPPAPVAEAGVGMPPAGRDDQGDSFACLSCGERIGRNQHRCGNCGWTWR